MGSYAATCLKAKKPKHKTEAILLTNSIKTSKMVHIRKKKKKKHEVVTDRRRPRKYFNNTPCGIPDWNPDRSRTVREELVKFT